MEDLDAELLERVARWCAEAGRAPSPEEIRQALGGLGWDELLAVRALLADPPPARPLGPFALADLARGVSGETAAARERDGAYPRPAVAGVPGPVEAAAPPAALPPAPPPAPRRPAGGKRAPRSPGVVIRRARDLLPPASPPAPVAPLVDELLLPAGRAVLERLIRRHGARRHALLAALAAGWRSAEGRPLLDADLDRLLDQHGLSRAFARRERDELLHALRAAGGLRAGAAARLGLERDAFDGALVRTGAAAEAERIREARRAEVRARATLSERVRLVLVEPARLEDLDVLAEVEEDLRRRLPEHVRAVGAGGGRLLLSLARSLSISPEEAQGLVERLGVPLGGPSRAGPAPRARRPDAAGAPGRTRPVRRPGAPLGDPRSAAPRGERRERREGRPRTGAPGGPTGRRPASRTGAPGSPGDRPGRRPSAPGGPAGRRPASRTGAPGGRVGRPGPRPGGPGRGRPPPRGPRRG